MIGDSGTGRYRCVSRRRQVELRLLEQRSRAVFQIHTGDVVALVVCSQQDRENFIHRCREWLVGVDHPAGVFHGRMIFHQPFLPVPGNHEHDALSPWLGLLSGLASL